MSVARTQSVAKIASLAARRTYAAVAVNASRGAALDVPLGGASEVQERASQAQVQTLANGVKVVALPSGGAVASVSVFVGGGLRAAAHAGAAEVLKDAIFSTTAQRTNLRQVRMLEQTGAQVRAAANRESFSYTANVLKANAGEVVQLLADGICAARLSEYDIGLAVEALSAAPARPCLKDLAHGVAFRFTGLGAPRGLPAGAHVSTDDVLALRKAVVVPSNIVVAAVGMGIDELAKVAADAFGGLPSGAKPNFGNSKYVGGESIAFSLARKAGGVAAFEAAGFKGDAVFSVGLALAQASGAAGTPFYMPYSDSGLIGTAFKGNNAEAAVGALAFVRSGKFSDDQLKAAKRRAAAAYLFAVESQAATSRDLAKQLLFSGAWRTQADTLKAINGVAASEVKAAFDAALKKPVTLVISTDGSVTADAASVAKAARA